MRCLLLLIVVSLAVPALAVDGPIPGTYKSQNGDIVEGLFSESWVDPPYRDGVLHNVIYAWSLGLGSQWKVYCPSILNVTLVSDTRDQDGTGFVEYDTDYVGGTLWLSQAGPWGNNEIDFTASVTQFKVTSTHQYFMGIRIAVVSDVQMSGQFDLPVEQCFDYILTNAAIESNTDLEAWPGNPYPPLLDYTNCPTGTVAQGAWGTADDITLIIHGNCTVADEASTWGKIKALYAE